MSLTEKIVAEFESLEKNLNGEKNHPLFGVRKEALSSFQKLGIPGMRHEEWKYTNIKTQLPESLSISNTGHFVPEKKDFNSFKNIKATRLVFVNGSYNESLSSILPQKGLIAGSLKHAWVSHKELIAQHYNKLVKKYEEHFPALNTAFATDGAFIYIENGVHVENPIFILHQYNSPETFVQSRNLVIAGDNCSAKIVVDFQNVGTASFYNHVSEIFVGKNSNIDVVKLQTATSNSTAVHTLEADVNWDSKFSCTTVSLEGKLIRNTTNLRLSGENVDAHLYGLYYAKGSSLMDNHILIDHTAPNCQSRQLYKGVLDDEATGIFNGKILVKQKAQKTNAYQSSKAILLSPEASVNSKPQLEIFADDVKCSHGAAIGQLRDDEIFYLESRGIEEKDAKSILTYAFANEIIAGIGLDELKDYLDVKLKAKLGIEF